MGGVACPFDGLKLLYLAMLEWRSPAPGEFDR